jgi:putative Mg2+ transporter-C (MgtC) family protein
VVGLTTAAGIWTTAIIGLAAGEGFYEGAFLTTLMVLFLEIVFFDLEHRYFNRSPDVTVYVEYEGMETLDCLLVTLRTWKVHVYDLAYSRVTSGEEKGNLSSAVLVFRARKELPAEEVLRRMKGVKGLLLVQKL